MPSAKFMLHRAERVILPPAGPGRIGAGGEGGRGARERKLAGCQVNPKGNSCECQSSW